MIDVVTRLRGSSAEAGKVDVVTRLRGRGGSARDVVTRLRGSAAATFTVGFAPPLLTQFNPFDRIPLTVAPSLPADTVTVAQASGPVCLLTGSGLDWSAVAPGDVAGGVVVFTVTARKAGYPDAVGTYSLTVLPHAGFFTRDNVALELMPDYSAPSVPQLPTVGFSSTATGVQWVYNTGVDFPTLVPVGGFTTMTTGADLGLLNPASPGGAAYSTRFKAKQNNTPDNSGNALYSAVKTLSVVNVPGQGNVLDMWLHSEGGQAYASAFKPLVTGPDGPNFLPYCRIEWRMRHIVTAGAGFGHACLLIGDNAHWPIWGEEDWTEGPVGGKVVGFRHPAQATDESIPVTGAQSKSLLDWHRPAVEWFEVGGVPTVRYLLDDQEILRTTDRVPAAPAIRGWLIQAGSDNAPVPAGAEAHIQVHWAAIWTQATG